MNIKDIRRQNVQRLIRDRFNGNQAAFARAIERPAPNVSRMLKAPPNDPDDTSDKRGIGEDLARDVERRLGLAHGFLDNPNYIGPDGNATMSVFVQANPSNVIPAPAISVKRVPLLSTVPAGNWREIVDEYMVGGAPDYDYSTKDLGEHGFALTVDGDSMLPDFRNGDVIFINPDMQPKPGCFVVARNHKLEATFKRYRPRGMNDKGEDYFELVPLNEDYPTLRSDQMAIEIIGVVVEHRRVTI